MLRWFKLRRLKRELAHQAYISLKRTHHPFGNL